MKAADYLKKRIGELAEILGNKAVRVRYAYEISTDFHIIEVSPETIRRGDKVYMEWEYEVIKEFVSLFDNEELIITEPDGSYDMSNLIYSIDTMPSYKFKGTNFGKSTFKSNVGKGNWNANYAFAA